MKRATFLVLSLLLSLVSLSAQNRETTVKALNNYAWYVNANIQALGAACNTMESYNSLFNQYLRKGTQLGGEEYEDPKLSPFLDEDVFTIGEDNPDHLYSVAIKGSLGLPTALKTELNNHAKFILSCSQRIVQLLDSMSTIFSAPLMPVTNKPEALPYRLLYDARQQLQLSKLHRDQLSVAIETYYQKSCSVVAPKSDYIHSVGALKEGMKLCQAMMNDLGKNDTSGIAGYVHALDSLHAYLENAELSLLKGIQPLGNSKHFPNKGVYNGFDLYAKYESMLDHFRFFSNNWRDYLKAPNRTKDIAWQCFTLHKEYIAQFNSLTGLVYDYNEYALLIGGGKMKLLSDGIGGAKYIYKGWGDGKRTLPVRTQLFWMKETPRFEVEFY